MSALSLQSLAERARDAGATLVDAIAGTPPYATRLARVSARSGYLCGLAPNAEWQRRYFVLKPTTMLYYFGSDMDEEPLGCVDVEAFTSVSCRDVDGNGRVVIELARAPGEGGGASPDDAGLTFRLRSGGEEEGYAWIDSLKNESYARLKETNEFLAKQCDEFAGEIARLEDVAKRAAEDALVAQREAQSARSRHELLFGGVDALFERLNRRPPDEPSVLGEALNDVFVPLLRQQFPEIRDFYLPPEACSYRVACVSIRKSYPGHAKRVMMAVWSFLRQFMYTKFVIVVDEDINVRNWADVIWAVSTRLDPVRDVTVIDNTPIDYLDFASPESGLGGKIGFDATIKIGPETTREWGRVLKMSESMIRQVTDRWAELGLPGSGRPVGD